MFLTTQSLEFRHLCLACFSKSISISLVPNPTHFILHYFLQLGLPFFPSSTSVFKPQLCALAWTFEAYHTLASPPLVSLLLVTYSSQCSSFRVSARSKPMCQTHSPVPPDMRRFSFFLLNFCLVPTISAMLCWHFVVLFHICN